MSFANITIIWLYRLCRPTCSAVYPQNLLEKTETTKEVVPRDLTTNSCFERERKPAAISAFSTNLERNEVTHSFEKKVVQYCYSSCQAETTLQMTLSTSALQGQRLNMTKHFIYKNKHKSLPIYFRNSGKECWNNRTKYKNNLIRKTIFNLHLGARY